MDKGGSVDEASLSLKRLRGGGLGGELLHWEPWKICRESLRIGASLSTRAPFLSRGTWYVGGARILGPLIDERRRALVVGPHSARDSIRGP